MRDITHKQSSLRTASGIGQVYCTSETIDLIENNQIPKGNIFEFARAAGFMAAKNTANLLPHCHPVSIDGLTINFEIIKLDKNGDTRSTITITCTAKSIGRTGIEMEVLTAISVAALTIYDMLKPVDKSLEIGGIVLLDKKGGKSDKSKYFNSPPSCAILVCSTAIAEGRRQGRAEAVALKMLQELNITAIESKTIADEPELIRKQILEWVKADVHFIFTLGGTGIGIANHAVDTVKALIDRETHGVVEAMYAHGQQRSAIAMMSRLAAGNIGDTMVVTLPGSTDGARECLEAILPSVFHARKMLKNTDG